MVDLEQAQSIDSVDLAVAFAAADGYGLKGWMWRHGAGQGPGPVARPVVVVNPATSVRCRYYSRFAAYLFSHGFDVLLYDYRGIGASRPASLRGFEADWLDWGRLDFEGALRFALAEFPGQPVHVVAHSVGGFLIGLAPSSHRIARVFSMGAQFAHWKDYQAAKRGRMFLKWHVFMPLVTALLGYFPGRRLGWLEDTPKGVVRDWTARHPRFEKFFRKGRRSLEGAQQQELLRRFAAVRADMLALSLSDDEFGTIPAIRRLLNYYCGSPRDHLHLRPDHIGVQQVGHFAFFHSRFQEDLWEIPLEWLRHGRIPTWARRAHLAHAVQGAQLQLDTATT